MRFSLPERERPWRAALWPVRPPQAFNSSSSVSLHKERDGASTWYRWEFATHIYTYIRIYMLVCIKLHHRRVWRANFFEWSLASSSLISAPACKIGILKKGIHIHACTSVCKCNCKYVCLFARMYVCIYVCLYVCMYVCIYVCMYVCMYVCLYIYIYMCVCALDCKCERFIFIGSL